MYLHRLSLPRPFFNLFPLPRTFDYLPRIRLMYTAWCVRTRLHHRLGTYDTTSPSHAYNAVRGIYTYTT